MKVASEAKDFLSAFRENFDAGALEDLTAGYTADGVMNLGGGNVLRGPDEIRGALANFLKAGLPMSVKMISQTRTGDTSVVIFEWRIEGNGPDGNRVDLGGQAVDVLRRGTDGVWRQLLDLPFGAATQ